MNYLNACFSEYDDSNCEFFSQGVVPPEQALQEAKAIARAKQSAYMPDGTNLSIWGWGYGGGRTGRKLMGVRGGVAGLPVTPKGNSRRSISYESVGIK